MILAVLKPGGDLATALSIVAFPLFIIEIKRGTHPTTAKQGNLIAAGGMAVAVVTTLLLDGIGNWGLVGVGPAGGRAAAVVPPLLLDGMGNWGLIVVVLAAGSAIGFIASVRVQMTQMPQMV